MSFPRYAEVKDSGVEWPGEVPAHWEVAGLGRVTLSKQAQDSEKMRDGLRDILLGPAQLYEALRSRGATGPRSAA